MKEIITMEEIQEKYGLELEKIISEIKKSKSKLVLLQFPDGLKPCATAVVDYLQEKTKTKFLIWFGSCYGACDIPVLDKKFEKKIDLIVQFGHNDRKPEIFTADRKSAVHSTKSNDSTNKNS